MKIRSIAFILLSIVFVSCSDSRHDGNFDRLIEGQEFSVLMFFAPDCPLCLTFSKPFNKLSKEYPKVRFIAVQSGEHYSTEEIQEYKEETALIADIYEDRDYTVAHRFQASVTPEFVLLDSSGKVYYQGLLDDRMESLGVYRQQWERFYLEEALKAVTEGKEPELTKTHAIGCDLEY